MEGDKAEPDAGLALNYVQRDEHDRQVRELKHQLSELVAENLEVNEMVSAIFSKASAL